MLRSIDSWDSEHFAFNGAESPLAAAASTIAVDNGPDGPTATIPDAHLLFTAQFSRAGTDLILQGEDGKIVAVHDYFASDARARLLSPEGAALSPDVVAALAGPLAPGQFAQAGGPQTNVQAVGRVAQVEGGATIIRNGVAMQANTGDAILKGDVLQTVTGSLGVTFNDGSTLNITANSRLVVNEFVYDPKGSQNSQLLDLVQGSLTFISGEVAHSGDMKIGTPVATMGIRGTVGGVTTANDGTVRFYVSQSATGAVILDSRGTIIANVVQDGPLIVVRPVGPLQVLAEELQKSPAQLATELAALQHIVSIKSVGDQLIQQFFQQNPTNNPNPQSTDHPHTQIPDIQIDLKPDPLADNGNNQDGYTPPVTAIVTIPPPPTPGTPTPPDPDPIIVTIPANLPPVNFGPLVTPGAATVSEEGLGGGIADGAGNPDTTNSATASGTIAAADGDGDSLTFTLGTPDAALTSNGVAITWVGAGTGTLTGVAGQTTIIKVEIDPNTGAYTITLSGPIDHPDGSAENTKTFDVPVNVTDGTATTVSNLTVTVEDDRPHAVDRSTTVTAGATATSVNLVIILDISGSMDTEVSGGQTRLELAQQALHNLLTTTGVDINQVMTVPFGSTANAHAGGLGSVWASASEADTFIQSLNTSGGTDYVAAINETMEKWGIGNNGPGSANKTLVYFISDGEPNPGLSGSDTAAWEAFLASHHVDVSNAIGISTNVSNTALAPLAWAAPHNGSLLPIILDDANDLDGTLQGTVENAGAHNIFTDGEATDAGFGADGGHIASIEIDGVIYSWDGVTLTKSDGETTAVLPGSSISVDTELGGHVEFHFAGDNNHVAGDWSYTPPVDATAYGNEAFHYVLADNDGDTSEANITVTVEPAIDRAVTSDWAVTSTDSNIGFTVNGEAALLSVDWGDGSGTDTNATSFGHNYSASPQNPLEIKSGNTVLANYNVVVAQSQDSFPFLLGTDGKDVLIGNQNATEIKYDPGAGNDVMFASAALDTFVFAPSTGHDTVVGFDTAHDVIDISAFEISNTDSALQTFLVSGVDHDDGLVFTDGNDSLFLQDVHSITLANLHGATFT